MKKEDLFRAVGDVGDDLIERADEPVRPARRKSYGWVKWACQKASQSLRPQAQIQCKSAFSGGVYVGKSSLQAASVEIARPTPRNLCAQQTATLLSKEAAGLF
jgi:hypothetical protein